MLAPAHPWRLGLTWVDGALRLRWTGPCVLLSCVSGPGYTVYAYGSPLSPPLPGTSSVTSAPALTLDSSCPVLLWLGPEGTCTPPSWPSSPLPIQGPWCSLIQGPSLPVPASSPPPRPPWSRVLSLRVLRTTAQKTGQVWQKQTVRNPRPWVPRPLPLRRARANGQGGGGGIANRGDRRRHGPGSVAVTTGRGHPHGRLRVAGGEGAVGQKPAFGSHQANRETFTPGTTPGCAPASDTALGGGCLTSPPYQVIAVTVTKHRTNCPQLSHEALGGTIVTGVEILHQTPSGPGGTGEMGHTQSEGISPISVPHRQKEAGDQINTQEGVTRTPGWEGPSLPGCGVTGHQIRTTLQVFAIPG